MANDESSISLTQYVRPLRLAFLVAPSDPQALLNAVCASACMWGGRYNAIVPASPRLPRWWPRTTRYNDVRSVVEGFLAAFEPEYVVVTADYQRQFAGGRDVLTMDDLLSDAHDEIGYGVSTAELFAEEYDRRYRFVLRQPVHAVFPADVNTKDLFAPAYAGFFPSGAKHEYMQRWFVETFQGSAVRFDANTYETSLQPNALTPFRAGSFQLDVDGPMVDPTFFLLNPREPHDVIQYWNLRALGWPVIGIPMNWANDLVGWCRAFITERYRPYPANPNVMLGTTLMAGHSVDQKIVSDFRDAVTAGNQPGLSFQHWYPRLWDEWAKDRDSATRCTLKHGERTIEVAPRDGRLWFADSGPSFAERGLGRDTPRWANVVRFQTSPYGGERAAAFPPQFAGLPRLLETFGDSEPRATSEGIVVRTRWSGHPQFWTLPSGVELFRAWLAENELTANLSSSGRLTLQIIRALDGMIGVNAIRHPSILMTLNQMAHGMAEYEDDTTVEKRKVRGRMLSQHHWLGVLRSAFGNLPKQAATNAFATLTSRGVLRVGVRVACPECGQRNWVAIDDMRSALTCERCLQPFPFPANDPPKHPWYYRTQGPFAVENYAQGGYTVALALRFLTLAVRGLTSWTPSMDIVQPNTPPLEIDFALWWQQDSFDYREPSLIFGEAKGYGGGRPESFTSRDIQRARRLARLFPGAFLVFATLKPELSKGEIGQLRSLARSGRRSWRTDSWRNPVIVLTAAELFGTEAPPDCWKSLDGKRGSLFAQRNSSRGLHPLLAVCDATQQAYLDLPGYWEWVKEQNVRRAARQRQPKE